MNSFIEYLSFIEHPSSGDELAENTGRFLSELKKIDNFLILKLRALSKPPRIIFNAFPDFNLQKWQKNFASLSEPIPKSGIIVHEGYFYYFLDTSLKEKETLVVLSRQPFTEETQNIFYIWKELNTLIKNFAKNAQNTIHDSQAHLISQVLHDINTLITIVEEEHPPEEQRDYFAYQKSLNNNLLAYIREIETDKTRVPVGDFINSSLALLNRDYFQIKLMINENITDINVDVELFSKAFNEIVKNAIRAVNEDTSKIEIRINIQKDTSPFRSAEWINIDVIDEGEGISEDFIAYVKTPFFTTHKQDGCGGFGLSIADKIITAHGGAMEIHSEQGCGTTISIYLPRVEEE